MTNESKPTPDDNLVGSICDTALINILRDERDKYKALASELAGALEERLEVVDEQCRFDHNGNCQAHLCFGYDNGCNVADAREVLARYKKEVGE